MPLRCRLGHAEEAADRVDEEGGVFEVDQQDEGGNYAQPQQELSGPFPLGVVDPERHEPVDEGDADHAQHPHRLPEAVEDQRKHQQHAVAPTDALAAKVGDEQRRQEEEQEGCGGKDHSLAPLAVCPENSTV